MSCWCIQCGSMSCVLVALVSYALVVCGNARSGGEGNCYGSSVPVLWLCCGCVGAAVCCDGSVAVSWLCSGPVVVAEVVLSYAVVVVSRAI